MNYAFFDPELKAKIWCIKPKIYNFQSGNNLFVFPAIVKPKRLKKAMSGFTFSQIPHECNSEFKLQIFYKTISQSLKEYNFEEIVFCAEKYMDNIEILTYFFKHNINFSIAQSNDCEKAVDFFLELYGFPIIVKNYIYNELVVYIDGTIPKISEEAMILDLSEKLECEKISVYTYLLKNQNFPIEISSLPLLQVAMELTETKIHDIIIKLCIIGTK